MHRRRGKGALSACLIHRKRSPQSRTLRASSEQRPLGDLAQQIFARVLPRSVQVDALRTLLLPLAARCYYRHQPFPSRL